MSGLRIIPLPPFHLGGGEGEGTATRRLLKLLHLFCFKIGVTENPSSSGYALYFEYMYVCHN